MSMLYEKDVGMTEYVGKHKGFTGILKLRYQDFLVNEINLNGEVIHLTNVDVMVEKKPVVVDEPPVLNTEDISVISKEDVDELKNLLVNTNPSASFIIKTAGKNKAERTEIHKIVSQYFPKLETKTIKNAETDEQDIKVTKFTKENINRRRQSREKSSKFCKFVMHKENIATMDAVNLIIRKLHLRQARCFHSAGNKDKRGVTVQTITTSISPERLVPINQLLNNIRIGNFDPCESALRLGDLKGNRFSIVIRNTLNIEEADLILAIKSFSQVGFLNYFGMQRFGTSSVATYEVGKSLIASKWENAVDLILSSCFKDCSEETINLIRNWREAGNARKALTHQWNKRSSFERYLLEGLAYFGPKQLVQSLGRIPRNTRMLYLHSYQSYVWNRVVSRRFSVYGDSPVVGDLVFAETPSEEPSTEPAAKKQKLDSSKSKTEDCGIPDVIVLTEENVHNYSIHDIVMPLPGQSISYPTHDAAKWYDEELSKDGIEKDMFNHKVKEYFLSGAYRKVVSRPSSIEWDIVRYTDYRKPLLISDIDVLDKKERPTGEKDGKYTALRISFSLPSSSYATVAMREVMKCDMSSTNQSKLGDLHKLECEGAGDNS